MKKRTKSEPARTRNVRPQHRRELELWAKRVQHAYLFESWIFDGGPDDKSSYQVSQVVERPFRESPEGPRRTTSPWRKIAERALELRIDPIEYVHLVFVGWPFVDRRPLPNQLLGDQAMEVYRKTEARMEQKLKIEWNSVAASVDTYSCLEAELYGCSVEEALPCVLGTWHRCSSVLVAYCLASTFKASNVLRDYEIGAATLYLQKARFYDKVWGTRIPERLKTEVAPIVYSVIYDQGKFAEIF